MCLAEVASRQWQVNEAVAAARGVPKWNNLPERARAPVRRPGDLIDQHVPGKSRRWKPPTPACLFTRLKRALIPRASHNFEFFAGVLPADEQQDPPG